MCQEAKKTVLGIRCFQVSDDYLQTHDIEDSLESWKNHIKMVLYLGIIIAVFSAFGLFASFYGRFIPMLIYLIYVMMGTIFCFGGAGVRVSQVM